MWSHTRGEWVGSIFPIPPTVAWAVHALKYVNVASKSHVWVLACSLPDGLPILYGTFPDFLCSYFETLWGTRSQGKSNPSSIADISWHCTDRKTLAKPQVEINFILLHLSAAASYIGAFGPFGLGSFGGPDGLSWEAWFCAVMMKDCHSTSKSGGTVPRPFDSLWRLNGRADMGAPGNWETEGLHRPHCQI